MTASTTSSAVFKTIDKIRKKHNIIDYRHSVPTQPIIHQGPVLADFQILKFIEEGQFGSVYLAMYLVLNKDTEKSTLSAR